MNKLVKIIVGTTSLFAICFAALVVQAGGWENFKLRYFYLTASLHNQDQELADLRQQKIDPTKYSRINLAELLNGGPPKDGIPSIDNPQFETAQNTPFPAAEIVIGVVINGEAKAYPYSIMNWHELVNDTVGGVNISVSYCPLCDTIVAFERGETTFGVSGKLYQSCLVMFDRSDDTLYSQPWSMGIVGAKVNHYLQRLPSVKTTLGAWLAQHPNSKILSTQTSYRRDYQNYPYGSYYTNEQLVFPVRNQDNRKLHPKAIVSYIWEPDQNTPKNSFSGASQQFIHTEIRRKREQLIDFNGRQVRATWDQNLATVVITELDGKIIPSSTAFSFVYPAYF